MVSPPRPGPDPKPALKTEEIQGAKYVRAFIELFAPLRPHRDCFNRQLHYDEFVRQILLYFFNPVVDSMRGLQQASELELVQRRFLVPRFSLGSFSEAGQNFDPDLLLPLIEALVAELSTIHPEKRFAELGRDPVAVDGSLIHAVSKMAWALWLDEEHRAAKLHLQFSLLKGAPTKAKLTGANASERTVLRELLTAGMLYVLDRGYAEYALMRDILLAQSSFVVRIRNDAVYQILEQRPLSKEAAAAGIEEDLIVQLGSRGAPELQDRPIRLVKIRVRKTKTRPGPSRKRRHSDHATKPPEADEYTLLLATDLLHLDVELIALLYQNRWLIELFFRWFKKVLEADCLLCQSENGLTIVIYVALIASLLVTRWTGRKPTKRIHEMFCFHLLGVASEAELESRIDNLTDGLPVQ